MKSIQVFLAGVLIFQAQIVLSQTPENEVAPAAPLLIPSPQNVETEVAAKQVPFIETQGKSKENSKRGMTARVLLGGQS